MTTPQIRSTAQLEPDGLAGYRKALVAIVGVLGTILAAVQPMFQPGTDWARWVGIAIAIVSAIGVYAVPNAIKPTPPEPVEPFNEV